MKRRRRNPGEMHVVKLTTASGRSWEVTVRGNAAEIKRYYLGYEFDAASGGRVIKVEFLKNNPRIRSVRRRNPTDMNIARTIIDQIIAADAFSFPFWAVRKGSLVGLDATPTRRGGVHFDVRGQKFKGRVVIELAHNDTYTIAFWKISRSAVVKAVKLKEIDDVYSESLYTILNDYIMGDSMGSRRNPRRSKIRIGKKRRRNPPLNNDPNIFRFRAAQAEVARSSGASLASLQEIFGDKFDPVGLYEIFTASRSGRLTAEETKEALAAFKAGTYLGLTVKVPEPAPIIVSRKEELAASRPQGKALDLDRDETIARIKAGLQKRSGKQWSVTGGRGTAWGWITIDAPPKRRTWSHRLKAGATSTRPEDYEPYDSGQPGRDMSPEDRAELGKLLGLGKPTHIQGESIPSDNKHRTEYVDRAEGREPRVIGVADWD